MLRVLILWLVCFASSSAWAAPRVAVQPFNGPEIDGARKQVARILTKHGFKALTSIPAVSGTGQYPQLAREHDVSAFVVADSSLRGSRLNLTFLVWQGVNGSVVGRWDLSIEKDKLAKTLKQDFWRKLGPTFQKLVPVSVPAAPAGPMRIDASGSDDEPIADRSIWPARVRRGE